MNTRKAYRMIVLIVCLLALFASMLACDDTPPGCQYNQDGILVCKSTADLQHYIQPSITDKAKEVVKQANQDISQNAAEFVDKHNDGTQWMDSKCMSFFEDCQ